MTFLKPFFKNPIVLNGTQIQIIFVEIEDRDDCCERHQQQTVMRNLIWRSENVWKRTILICLKWDILCYQKHRIDILRCTCTCSIYFRRQNRGKNKLIQLNMLKQISFLGHSSCFQSFKGLGRMQNNTSRYLRTTCD